MEKEQMFRDLMKAVDILEGAVDAKTKYKAESQICRLASRLGVEGSVIYGHSGAYVSHIDRDGDTRAYRLTKVLGQEDLDEIAQKQNASGLSGRVFLTFQPMVDLRNKYVDYALVDRGKRNACVEIPSTGFTGVLDENEGRAFGVLPESKKNN
jgi:hypothetical protein